MLAVHDEVSFGAEPGPRKYWRRNQHPVVKASVQEYVDGMGTEIVCHFALKLLLTLI
jgi:hypothetical protein